MATTETTKVTCGAADPKRRAWCVLLPGHPGRHQDSWGKKFAGEPHGRLADLPRYLRANGHKVIATLAEEHLAKVAEARASLTAVLHQLEHGEASDAVDLGLIMEGTQGDLRWCREQLREALKSIS
jgi:hypothetical protein